MQIELPTGATLAVDRFGARGTSPLVLLHGLSSSRETYGSVVEHLLETRPAGQFEIITVDLRGHGESSHAAPDDYDARSYAADLAALLAVIDAGPAVVVGHSLGGLVATALAVNHAHLVRAAFLEDPPLFEGDPARRAASPAAAFFPMLVAAIRELQGRQAPIEEYARFAPPGQSPEQLAVRSRGLLAWDPATMDAALSGLVWKDFNPLVAPACPTMLVRADPAVGAVFSPDDEVQLRAVAPAMTFAMVSGAGHEIHDGATKAAYLAHLDAFLDDIDGV